MNWLKKYWRATLFVAVLILLLFIGVMAFHFEETANKPFWYNTWPYIGVVCIALFIGGIWWFTSSKKKW